MLNDEYYEEELFDLKIEIAENKREYITRMVEFRLDQQEAEKNCIM